MAIEIGPIAKPQIWLVGDEIMSNKIEFFSERVDHARAVEGLVVTGTTTLKQEKLLTFDKRIRIIITSQIAGKPTYVREGRVLESTEFEGNQTNVEAKNFGDDQHKLMGQYSETYYTINGKDPVRTKINLYNYLDMNSLIEEKINIDPSALKSNEIDTLSNLEELGFILSANQTGSEVITLKARTFYQGNKSNVSIARFKIVIRSQISQEFENFDPQKTL